MCCFPLSLFSSLLPSIPPRYSLSGIVSFSPLCALTGLFLSLIAMAGSTPLHNAADIFPTGDPTGAAAALPCIHKYIKKGQRQPSSLPPNPYFSVSSSPAKASTVQQGSGSTRLVCFGESLGPGLIEINAYTDWDDIYEA